MKKLISSATLLLLSVISYSQKNHTDSDYILFKGQDTTFCHITEMGGGTNIDYITYTDSKGNEVKLKDRDLETIISVKIDYFKMYNVPNPNQPTGKHALMKPDITGKICLYSSNAIYARTTRKGERELLNKYRPLTPIVVLDNGKAYWLDKKSVENEMLPYMNKCSKFKSIYNDYSKQKIYDNFSQDIAQYNDVCK